MAAIEIDDVTKVFKIYKDKVQSAKERAIKFGRNPHDQFKALDGVSMSVAEGETLAILGHNGSGKSTLLKCVSGTLRPTSGRISVQGRLAALLELGAGFHPELTGRENVFLNGSILGFSKPQVERIFDDIVEFAELQGFIDNQVKHYSSGMYARLGFAVAINVEPDVLVVDEVLSVGDEAFQRKCIERVKQFQRTGRTILVVSHAAELVRQVADRAAVLDHGQLIDIAVPGEAIRTFRETLAKRGLEIPEEALDQPPPDAVDALPIPPVPQGPTWSGPPSGTMPAIRIDKAVQITAVKVEYPDPDSRYLLPDQPMRLRIDYVAPARIDDISFAIEVHDESGNLVFSTDTETVGMPIHAVDGVGAVCFDVDRVPLLDGTYPLTVVAQTRDGGTTWDRRDQQDHFEVMNPGRENGMVHLPLKIVHYFHGEMHA